MKTQHKIVIGDSREMKEIESDSLHLVITSPPYWQLKDYGHAEQIGYYDSYEDYINNLNLVWEECYRVLHSGCRLCINIGDQFARSVYYGRYKVIPIRTEIIKFCESIGFDYMGAIIWQKVTTTNTTGGATIMGSYPYPRNGIIKLDYEFILLFRKLGKAPKVEKDIKEKSILTIEEWNEYFYGHWNFPGDRQDRHIAVFPLELPSRLIKMFSFVGDTILDPFLGSGTTTLSAKTLDRNSIGYEINGEYLDVIRRKVGIGEDDLFRGDESFEIVEGKREEIDFKERLEGLPYIFRDPLKFDKKVDPKKLRFGSKIDGSEGKGNNNLYSIKTIDSPNTLVLDTGQKVRLLGICPVNSMEDDAIDYLNQLLKGQKVFIKFDDVKLDENDIPMVYMYLRNKKFINRHLISSRLVTVDTDIEYREKKKFVKIYENAKENI